MEKGDIVAVRLKFWRKIHRLREFSDSRPVFYLDETRANISGRITLGTVGSKYLYGKQAVLSLATQDRLIRVSYLRASESSKSTCDYHEELTSHTFLQWFLNRFINCGQCELPFGCSKQGA